jgi:hypothetical protein
MLGRKDYTRDEFDTARTAIDAQLAAYRALLGDDVEAPAGEEVQAARREFDGLFFNNMTFVLDRYFVYRLRMSAGSDGNPLNEVEMICDSLMYNGGILRPLSPIKYLADLSVLRLRIGDRISLSGADFERLSTAFFAELERRFL